ncbi:formylglycine-generating enzyme family protein [Sphingobium naphthae]|uniref:formylglycine-generating enzyme family protein n=1 Tax=Sphingobium naphthae TaxID=1886786 RepID=UPI003749DC12
MSCCPPPIARRHIDAKPATSGRGPCVDHDWISVPAGTYRLGGEDDDANPQDGEGPVRNVLLSDFAIAATTVTNGQFEAFVKATGYRTEAESIGWSFVFHDLVSPTARKRGKRVDGLNWWIAVDAACWRWPGGRGSHIADRRDHPVVHISWNDAVAYCMWSGTRLPTEAQWEAAARGGLVGAKFPWGDELSPEGRHMCNVWQGRFPVEDSAQDGFHGTSPVRSFPPNGYGLYDMAGNVWEWCADWFGTNPATRAGLDPVGPATGTARVMRGGSFLCHESYCNRYRVAARTSNEPDSASSNIGFRVVAEAWPG